MQSEKSGFRALSALFNRAGQLGDWTEGHPWVALLLFTVFYLVPTVFASHHKPLWYDELIGVIGSQVQPWTSIPEALRSGIDLSPPFYHFFMRASMELFGDSNVVIRLHAIIGFYLLCLSLFLLVRRRSGSTMAGLAAAILPLGTHLYVYATESRAYPLAMGLSALSFRYYCIATEDGPGRRAALFGMTLATMAAVSVHYYGFLILAVLAVAEAVRWYMRRRIDWSIVAGVALSCVAMIPHLIAARAHRSFIKGISITVNWASAFYTYDYLLAPVGTSVAFLLILAAVIRYSGEPETTPARALFPPHELAGVVTFALLPFPGMIIAMLVTKQYLARYTSPMVIGYALLLVVAIYAISQSRRGFLFVAVLLLTLASGFEMAKNTAQCLREKALNKSLLADAAAIDDGKTPIAVQDVLTFLPLWHYATPEQRKRFVFVVSTEDARRYFSLDVHDIIVSAISRQRPDLLAPSWQEFQSSLGEGKRFLVWGESGGWVTPKLAAEGKTRLQLKRLTAHGPVFLVEPGQ